MPYVRPALEDGDTVREPFAPSREDPSEVRSLCVFKEDVINHGATEGCPGCRGLIRGCSDKHSSECRQIIAELQRGDPKRKRKIRHAEVRGVRAQSEQQKQQWKVQVNDPKEMQKVDAAGSERQGPEPCYLETMSQPTTTVYSDVC